MEQAAERVRKRKRFSELTNREKAFRVCNLCVAAGLALLDAGYLIFCIVRGDPDNRIFTCCTMFFALAVPFLAELLFRMRLSNFVVAFYYAYLTVAGVVGALFGVYSTTWWYDLFAHGIFGYVGGVAGLFLLAKLRDYDRTSAAGVTLFCFCVSMAMGAVWEILEFTADQFFAQTSQGLKDAAGFTPVNDTMEDILMNFLGAVVFTAHYIAHRVSRKNLLLGSIVKDFCANETLDKRAQML